MRSMVKRESFLLCTTPQKSFHNPYVVERISARELHAVEMQCANFRAYVMVRAPTVVRMPNPTKIGSPQFQRHAILAKGLFFRFLSGLAFHSFRFLSALALHTYIYGVTREYTDFRKLRPKRKLTQDVIVGQDSDIPWCSGEAGSFSGTSSSQSVGGIHLLLEKMEASQQLSAG